MGNKFICMNKKDTNNGGIGSRSKRGSLSKRRSSKEEELLHRQALAMAIQQHQISQRFDSGSMSRRLGSTSSRRRASTLPDPFTTTDTKPVKFDALPLFLISQFFLFLLMCDQDLKGQKGWIIFVLSAVFSCFCFLITLLAWAIC